MARWGTWAVLALGLLPMGAAAQETPADIVKQVKTIDWKKFLSDPQARGFLASLIHRVLPMDLQERATEEQIADGLGAVVEEIDKMPPNLSAQQEITYLAENLGQRLFPDEIARIKEQLQKALESLPDFIREEDGRWVITLEKAGSLRIKYEENPYRGITTVFNPFDPIKRGAILLSAENIKFELDGSHLEASGDVALRDKTSSLIARQIRYDGPTKSMVADGLTLRLPSIKFDAGKMADKPNDLDVEDLNLRATIIGIPVVSATAKNLNILGEQGMATGVRAKLLGIPVYSRDELEFRLDGTGKRDPNKLSFLERLRKFADLATLFKPPTVNFFSKQPSITYANQYDFGNRQMVGLTLDAQRHQYLASEGIFTWNLSSSPESDPSVLSTGEVKDDFIGGYVQNASIRRMDDYVAQYRQPRRTPFVGFSYNQRVELRDVEDIVSQPLTIGYEFGGPIGSFGAMGQVRYQQAKSFNRGETEQRGVFLGSLGLFYTELGRGFSLNGRIDGAAYKPSGEGYAWIRPVVSLQARLLPQFFVSTAYVNGREFGKPFSIAEEYLAGPEYHVRFDFNFGPTQITYANRYSVRQQLWYRSQVYFAQDIDAFQLFIQTDQQLSRFSFGLNLRLDEILTSLRSRRYTGVSLDRPEVKKK